MTTFVGQQTDFAKALKELVELEYEALEAYEAAINRIESANYKQGLVNAKAEHKSQVSDLTQLLTSKGIEAPRGPSGTQLISIGKVAIANLFGDNAILKAIIQLEEDINTAYKRMTEHDQKFIEAEKMLTTGLANENRHITWLKTITE